ncbi:MAG: transglutaminaseTgpA domain-containing protein [Deltaproteobacteria bacterium]|nr:transglutaminaseTgpA domain-containing protein [Deltaproteobacteria bacterium]
MKLSLGRAHELGLCASLTASMLIVLFGGEFPIWVWPAGFAPVLSLMLRRRGVVAPGFSGTLLALAAIGAGVATFVRTGVEGAVFAGGATLLGVLAARVLTRATIAHDLQAIALSLVLVLAGSVLNVGMSYFFVFVGYAISTVWALATRQLLAGAAQTGMAEQHVRARDDVITPLFFVGSAAVSVGVLAAALVVFISFPRIGFGELGFLNRKESKLPASVGFGGDPRGLSTSTELVARLRGVPRRSFEDGLYLRGIVYDEINLEAFSQSAPDATDAPILEFKPQLTSLPIFNDRVVRYEVTLVPLGGDLLFHLGHVRIAQTVSGGAANPNRTVMIGGRDRHDELKAMASLSTALRYEIQGSASPPGELPKDPPTTPKTLEDRERYLKVPTSPTVDALVARLNLAGRPQVEIVEQLRLFFDNKLPGVPGNKFRYSLEGEVVGEELPLQAFLIDMRAGHCELFAGAFALMLRKLGVPARVVGGFQGGALASDGSIVFQQRHAHAWVEWWKDDYGWIVDDATPEPTANREELHGIDALIDNLRRFWDDRVVDYSLSDQQTALQTVLNAVRGKNLGKISKAVAASAVVVVGVGWLWRRVRRRASEKQRANKLAEEILRAVKRLKGDEPWSSSSSTLREAIFGHDHAVLRKAVSLYEQARFGNIAVDDAELLRLIEALRALKPPR